MEDKFIQDQEARLKVLRKKWSECTYRKEKQFIERQAKLIKHAIEMHNEQISGDKELTEVAQEVFGY